MSRDVKMTGPQSFGLLQLATKKILEDPWGYEWTMQGLGMLRLYLSESVRLHIWSVDFRDDNASPIHDHPWGLRSTVIGGCVENQVLREVSEDWLGDRMSMMKQTLRCGVGCELQGSPEETLLATQTVQKVFAGGSYEQDADEIHWSKPKDGTVTIVERQFKADRDHARVFWKRGEQWRAAEPRKATNTEISEITERALKLHFSDVK